MTSVQNLRLLLSGSKLFVFLLCGILAMGFTSCDIFKKSQKSRKPEVTTAPRKAPEKTREKMDTVYWKQPAGKVPPPIKDKIETVETTPVKKDLYKIAVLLPLYTARISNVSENTNVRKMLHFGMGMRLAAEKMSRGNPRIDFVLLDIEAGNNRLKTLLDKDSLAGYDAIVGPFKTEDLQAVASYGLKKGIPVISPWNSSGSIVIRNPLYIQLRPGLPVHSEAIAAHVAQHHRGARIFLVARDSDTREMEAFDYFKNSVAFQKDALIKRNIQDWLISSKTGTISHSEVRAKISGPQQKVLIIPYWSHADFVVNLLNQLSGVKGEKDEIFVYGFPQWMQFEKLDYALYKSLNIRLSYNGFIELRNEQVRSFRSTFFERYKALPEEDAFYGHDILLWLGRELATSGTGFITKADKKTDRDLFNPIDLFKVTEAGQPVSDDLSSYRFLENRAIQIIKLEDYRFSGME